MYAHVHCLFQVLAAWLNSNPNYAEVTGWYQGWKGVVPVQVHIHPGIKEHFQQVGAK